MLSSALLPLTICAIIIAAIAAVVVGLRPAWRQLLALAVISAVAGAGSYLIAQTFLGALPHDGFATWAALSLLLFALSATTAGLVALIGPAGLAISAALMVFVGNPFSGVTSAPELLPGAADHLGQWLPPGAGANLLRSTAYFNGHGAGPHLLVLALWAVGGVGAIVVGHHTSPRFAAHPSRRRPGQSTMSSSTSKNTNRTPADPSWPSTGNNAPASGVVTAALRGVVIEEVHVERAVGGRRRAVLLRPDLRDLDALHAGQRLRQRDDLSPPGRLEDVGIGGVLENGRDLGGHGRLLRQRRRYPD